MVKLIVGRRGSGKTKLLLDEIRAAKEKSNGNVVAIQIGNSLNSHVRHDVRLINIEDYGIGCCRTMSGFMAGIMASDYDCTHIFVDGILKIVGKDFEKVGDMLARIDAVSGDTLVTFTFSADLEELNEGIKKYL